MVNAAAKWVPDLLEVERVSIYLPTKHDYLRLRTTGGPAELPTTCHIPMEDVMVGQAFTEKRLVNVADLAGVELEVVEPLVAAGLRSAVLAPLMHRRSAVGTVNLFSTKPAYFDEAKQEKIRVVAEVIGSFIAAHQHMENQQRRANTDSMTRLLGRTAILRRLSAAFNNGDHRPAVLYIDVNSFKGINDSHGHAVGDQLLQEIADRIQTHVRPIDAVGRLGGDEFLVVVERDLTGEAAIRLASRITEAMDEPVRVGSLVLDVNLSIGVANVNSLGDTAENLLWDADHTMYTAKSAGMPVALISPEIRRQSAVRAAIDHDLEGAMTDGGVEFHIQPVRHLGTYEILGAEALVRWTHPELGAIPAELILERTQATGRTDVFTRWTIDTVIGMWQEVRREAPWFHDKAIAINLAPRQLAWTGLADYFLEAINNAGFRPEDIFIEVVESAEIGPGTDAEHTLAQLGRSGAFIVLDDFGTGHNVLDYLTRFHISGIKFDRALVGATVRHGAARRILNSLNSLADELGIATLAEGLETEAEAKLCLDAGIPAGQGWLLGYPEPLESFIKTALADRAAV